MLAIRRFLFQPMDNSPLVLFRMFFGFLLAAEGFGAILTGWVYRNYVEPEYHFPFIPFEWLTPLPGYGMYGYYSALGMLGLMVMLGYRYRLAMTGYAVLWSGTYFMQKIHYNNHYYLMVLLCWIAVTMDLHRYASLDVRRNPSLRSLTCPHWYKVLLVSLLVIVFFYASKAKWYPGWVEGDFIGYVFAAKKDFWLIGPWLQSPVLQQFVIWGGIIFDFVVIPMLLFRPTRWLAFAGFVFFNLFNSVVFHIGIFPFLMIGSSVLFFTPEAVRERCFPRKPKPDLRYEDRPLTGWQKFGLWSYGLFLLVMILLPVRYHLLPGKVLWTEEAHRMSWRMMLRTRYGRAIFRLKDRDTGKTWSVTPATYLTKDQARKVASHPDMLWQYAQWMKRKLAHEHPNLAIYVEAKASINGGPFYTIVDPCTDLTQAKWTWYWHDDWIINDPVHYQGPKSFGDCHF